MAMAAFITGNILIMALCVVSLIIHARRDHTLVDNLEEYRAQLEALRQKSAREREARLLAPGSLKRRRGPEARELSPRVTCHRVV